MAKQLSTAKTINIALQGGGAFGALTWGVLDRLLEDRRIKFDAVSATSAGAMNGVLLVQGLATGSAETARELLSRFWKMVSEASERLNPIRRTPLEEALNIPTESWASFLFFDTLTHLFSPQQLNPLKINPLRDILEKIVDFDAINSSNVLKLFISATNVQTGKIKVFQNSELSIDAVMASACLPTLFPAVKIGEEYFWDGGFMGNPAFFPLFYNSDCRDILVVHILPIYRHALPETQSEILNRINEVSFNSSLMREMRAIAFVNRILDNDWLKEEQKHQIRRVYMHAIRMDNLLQSATFADTMNASWPFISHLFEQGRQHASVWLDENFSHIGKKTTIDMNEYL
jgi:NTE family protein